MPRLTKKEWILIKYACRNLWDSLDITNGDIQYRQPDIFKENKKRYGNIEQHYKEN